MTIRSLVLPAAIALCLGSLPAMAKGPGGGPPAPTPVLSAEEAGTLLWMREEEKLAHDVYVALDAQWDLAVLERIAASEQRHFDALGDKLDRYGLTDPTLPGEGTFSVADLQALYDDLVAAGLGSSAEALTVGATIEDLDILDLLHAIEQTDQPDLERTYDNLLEGSKNHLRAFVRELRALGLDYEPQYIDPLLFDAIVGV
ncbi:DUF2202 domain-containing protein [uncultured Thiohalocapsa sp.]|uniref:DUF2202 domain-containing protein n=1 Tax=uncultured Thiohalocapsa sp. TaxID=768990 RepID=UPI0025FFFC92|nr:DUF2202 domain-containing protein [uncultured Thiohalocapsa sp.]